MATPSILVIGGPANEQVNVARRSHIHRVDCTAAGLLEARESLYSGCDAVFWPTRNAGPLPEKDLRQLVKGVWDGGLLLLVIPKDYPTWSDAEKWVFNWFWSKLWLCVGAKPATVVQYSDPVPSHPIATCLKEIGKRASKAKAVWPLVFNMQPNPAQLWPKGIDGLGVPIQAWEPKLDGIIWEQRDQSYIEARVFFKGKEPSIKPGSWREMWRVSDTDYDRYGLSEHLDGYYASPWVRAEPPLTLIPCHVTRVGKLTKSLLILSGNGGIGIVPAVLGINGILQSFQVALESRVEPEQQTPSQAKVKLTIECHDIRIPTPGQGHCNWSLTVNGHGIQMGHWTFLKLLAFVVADLAGQPVIDVTEPAITGISIRGQFRSRRTAAKHKDEIQRAVYGGRRVIPVPRYEVICTKYNDKGKYWLNSDHVTVGIDELHSSCDPDVQKLLALAPDAPSVKQ